jgi:23S rRNA pseudouridine2604 synthase
MDEELKLIRINKYLKDSGLCSRRMAETFILKGYISVNNQVITDLATKINPKYDKVSISPLAYKETEEFCYILLNKPKGYVCSKNRSDGKLIFDLVPNIKNLTYAGRLDKDSHGLVVLSNDGQFVYKLLGNEFNKEKEYIVRVDKPITKQYLDTQSNGTLIIDNQPIRPAKVQQIGSHVYKIILTQGINRQIRKMANALGYNVIDLKRIRIDILTDNGLSLNKWRYLTQKEVKQIMQTP